MTISTEMGVYTILSLVQGVSETIRLVIFFHFRVCFVRFRFGISVGIKSITPKVNINTFLEVLGSYLDVIK